MYLVDAALVALVGGKRRGNERSLAHTISRGKRVYFRRTIGAFLASVSLNRCLF